MDERLRTAAAEAIGFMPEEEGLALYSAGKDAAPHGPLLEIGSYCGKSAVYLGAAAQERGSILFSLDHHRGSEEHQPGEEFHDPRLIDPAGHLDTLPIFRRTIVEAALDDTVIAILAPSALVARYWTTPLALVFIDGGHSSKAAAADYEGWAPHVIPGGSLVIHDVFERPQDGGRAPFEIYQRALRSGAFEDESGTGSLRVLRRIADGL